MWLSHHDPGSYDRCVLVAGRPVCRRCLVLYPLAFVVVVVAQATGWSGPTEVLAVIALPLPAVAEFVLEHRGVLRYSPGRQVLVTIPLAVGLGAGFDRYLDRPGDVLFWSVVVAYTGVCLWSALAGRRR